MSLFISFEGGDGSGKSTQVRALVEWLEKVGHDVVATREPGGTPMGNAIRDLLLHGGEMGARAEALLYAADRAHHVDSLVRPALKRGAVVVTDRYLDSSVAYQGAARDVGTDEVRDLSLWAVGGLLPDVTFLLDLPAAAAAERASRRSGGQLDRLERAGAEFHDAVRAQFRALARREPQRFYRLDATRPIEDLAHEIREVVVGMFEERRRGDRREDGSFVESGDTAEAAQGGHA
ncbi:dTMP kinase [Trueperella pecoris]|uniref:dTMP kinase n=1 Tax=Trueperella pecoris TaxID=2733571 RepID=UPI001ABDBB16|nr:dTMP kinase [Trueperella pecoris]QTG75389.1 dTMP kinase [Trueperella pecoris]